MEFQRSKHHSFSESILRQITIHIIDFKRAPLLPGKVTLPDSGFGWLDDERDRGRRVTQFDKSGDDISHTRRDCVQRSPSDDAKPELRRSPSESEMHRLRERYE